MTASRRTHPGLTREKRVFDPNLAVVIGLNEAIVLQQVHYWLERSKHYIDGRVWIYNSVPGWRVQFPFWSEDTVARTIKRLEVLGLLISANLNDDRRDRTKWYTIDFDVLHNLEPETGFTGDAEPQNGSIGYPQFAVMEDRNNPVSSIRQRLPTETTPERDANASAPLEQGRVDLFSDDRGTTGNEPPPKARKTSGQSLAPLADAFTVAGVPLPKLGAKEVGAAQLLLKDYTPEQIAGCWRAVVDGTWGDQFLRDNLSLAMLTSHNRVANWDRERNRERATGYGSTGRHLPGTSAARGAGADQGEPETDDGYVRSRGL